MNKEDLKLVSRLIMKSSTYNAKLSMYKIKCPNCGVTYDIRVDDINENDIVCMDCGTSYNQILNVDNIGYIRNDK